ncbi:UNVERIFIED_CONTAM: hypothetical protein FKN15_006442 [Acipenser sinensis]
MKACRTTLIYYIGLTNVPKERFPPQISLCIWISTHMAGQYGNPLNKYIKHYEGLSYDTDLLHRTHERAKRALSPADQFVHLDFHAHGRPTVISQDGALDEWGVESQPTVISQDGALDEWGVESQ